MSIPDDNSHFTIVPPLDETTPKQMLLKIISGELPKIFYPSELPIMYQENVQVRTLDTKVAQGIRILAPGLVMRKETIFGELDNSGTTGVIVYVEDALAKDMEELFKVNLTACAIDFLWSDIVERNGGNYLSENSHWYLIRKKDDDEH